MKKILIVDDMPVSLLMTENILATQYITVCANSGAEAIEIFHKERPDMVLSDLHMPSMSGYELQSTLQEQYQQVIPFMFMTADSNEETESKGFDNGAMDFIRKPFRPDVLLRRVANILQTVDQIQGLKKNAEIDALTGLNNKSSSESKLKNICKSSTGALMMIDLDSFKLVNDIHGHAMGDKILIAFADILKSAFRPNDLLGRMGGDEFIAFCYGMTDEQGVASKSQFINEKLIEVAKSLMGEDMNIPLGASIGCVLVPNEGVEFNELYKLADKSLYIVKQNGKHGYNVYSLSQKLNEMEISDDTDLLNIQLILDERNSKNEAFILSLENFRSVYRFIKRINRDGRNSGCILFFSLSLNYYSESFVNDVSESFLDTLKQSLRRSDTVTQLSSNQFIIILYDLQVENVHLIVERIVRNWEQSPFSEQVELSHEFASILN